MIADVINKYNDRDSLYGNKLTNHLNMALFALYKMGADEARLNEFAKEYISQTNLPPLLPPDVKISKENFCDHLGRDGSYSSYILYFENELNNKSIEEVLKEYIIILLPGEAGGAFHGVIRLAYAYALNDKNELVRALAYFAEAYKEFPFSEELQRSMKVIEPIRAVSLLSKNSYFQNFKFHRPLIIGRMEDIYEDPQFLDVLSDLSIDYCNSRCFSELLLKLYSLTGEFTVLHGFTSTHALRLLSPFINNYKLILKQHWYLLQLAYLSTNCTPISEYTAPTKVNGWSEIFTEACKSKDVHTIKLVYSLYEQSSLSEDDCLYRSIAQDKSVE